MTPLVAVRARSGLDSLRDRLSLRAALGGPPAIWLFSLALVVIATGFDVLALAPQPALMLGGSVPWWVICIGFAVAEIFVIEFTVRNDSHSFTLSELPLVVGLFLLPPAELLLAQALGSGAALLLQSPRQPIKVIFNLANVMVGGALAVVVFRAIVSTVDPLGASGWLAGFAAAIVSDTSATLLVLTVIAINEGRTVRIPRLVGLGTLYTLADTSLALVSVIVLRTQPGAAWLLIVLTAVFFFGYRAYGSLRQRHQSLERLQASTRSIQESVELDHVAATLLTRIREMFGAEEVELAFFPMPGEPGRFVRLDMDGAVWEPLDATPRSGAWSDVAKRGRTVRLPAKGFAEGLGAPSRATGREAIAAPLRDEASVIGAIVVIGRESGGPWRGEHLTVLETLANHAGVSIQNGRLVERLRRQAREHEYEATHDPLTGLANRTLFRRRLVSVVADAGRRATGVAVMTMDLDRFKEVNDTLGHHSGDELLRQVAERLVSACAEPVLIARLSGDEFAVLIADTTDAEPAVALAMRIDAAFEAGFPLQELHVEVEASMGVALFPEHGADADTLLQRADVAMYSAKTNHSIVEVYRPEADRYSTARLALMGELRKAIEDGELTVFFQPQLDTRSGTIRGAEALVRWVHPKHGTIHAGEFVPLIEHSGLIRPLALFVLDDALRSCREWRLDGDAMAVSVNLSVRNLLDATLGDEIALLLARHELPGSALTVEITETSLMAEQMRPDAVLDRLKALGVGVSIDDFGTGYASLSYLKRFPVTELKIDREFVRGIEADADDVRIVRSTIELAHGLGLRVVAEGAETPGQTERLISLGCDVIQGYHVGRPLPASDLTKRLSEQRGPSALWAPGHRSVAVEAVRP